MVENHIKRNWSKISLDGLSPGMPIHLALQDERWIEGEDEGMKILMSRSFGFPDIGFPYSFALLESGKVSAISGKILKENNVTLFEMGSPCIQAKTTLGWDGRSELCSPDGRFEIQVACGNRRIVEGIVFKLTESMF